MLLFLALLLVASWLVFISCYYLPLRRLRHFLKTLQPGADPYFSNPGAAELILQIGAQASDLLEAAQLSRQSAQDEGLNLKTILSSMSEGVVLLDNRQRIRLANPAIQRLLPPGLSPINRTLLELFRNHLLQRAVENSLSTLQSETAELIVEVVENGQLISRSLSITCTGMAGRNGEMVGALVVFHDLTRLKALEGMRKDFVANVSHELRTPLSIISGYIETMLDDDLEDVVSSRKFLRVMHKHTQRLHLLVEDLLTISLLESHRAALDFQFENIPKSIQRVLEQLETALQSREMQATLDFPSDFPLVEMDPRRMDQVFFNLLDNAIKHGRNGDAPITIIGSVLDDKVCISIRDHGPGISPKDQPHIFERFYRVDEGRSREVGGTGLGLSIVKHVILAHGGTVEVASQRGNGTTFLVFLPIRQTPEIAFNS